MNGDGLRDLLLGRHGSRVEVYLNRGELSFERAPQWTSSFALKDHHATVVSDFDHDGQDDFYFVAGAHRGLAPGPNALYLSSDRYAADHARTWKVEDALGRGRGGLVVDVDGDNMTELLVTNYRSALRSFAFVGESSTEHKVLEQFGRPPLPTVNSIGLVSLELTAAGLVDFLHATSLRLISSIFPSRRSLILENVALRHQLQVLGRQK